jgi:hypothetical protein
LPDSSGIAITTQPEHLESPLKIQRFFAAGQRLLLIVARTGLGAIIGLVILEGVLHVNPGLLFRGMALPAPADPPITVREYDVRYSDADAFVWRPDLVRPVPPDANLLEAHVRFETDEFGFRNKPPLPPQVDAVVLGLSISLGAQVERPWPTLLAQQKNWAVLNLSQPGSGIETKSTYLQRYGLPRHPRWVLVEVQPSIDIIGRGDPPTFLTEGMFVPLAQKLVQPFFNRAGENVASTPIYPLRISISGRTIDLTCCLHYMEVMTLDRSDYTASVKWVGYSQRLLDLVGMAKRQSACVALLYAPIKPDIYFPLANDPDQLSPVLKGLAPLRLKPNGILAPDPTAHVDIMTLRNNAMVGRDVIAEFARQHGLAFVDPSQSFIQAILNGTDPFMVYDSHWNETGHQLVAQQVMTTLQNQDCK